MEERTYLERLGAELRTRQWRTKVLNGSKPVLRVTNPDAPTLAESIICRDSGGPDGYTFCWSWNQAIGPAHAINDVADRIQQVLRKVES